MTTDSSQRPTRVVRARDLTQGDVVLNDCAYGPACIVPAGRHRVASSDPAVVHELTLLDTETHGAETSAIYVSETGEQGGTKWVEWSIVHVYADTPARTGAGGG